MVMGLTVNQKYESSNLSLPAKCSNRSCGKPFKIKGNRTKFCSIKCKNRAGVKNNRERIKVEAIKYKGGKCINCGYNRCNKALEFHHLDPSKKDFGISRKLGSVSWDKVKNELDKCVLLCANCHTEIHSKLE